MIETEDDNERSRLDELRNDPRRLAMFGIKPRCVGVRDFNPAFSEARMKVASPRGFASRSKAVVNVTTGKRYATLSDAAQSVGGSPNGLIKASTGVPVGGRFKYMGNVFERVDPIRDLPSQQPELVKQRSRKKGRKVQCLDTGETYDSVTQAAELTNCKRKGLWAALNKSSGEAVFAGKRWKFIDVETDKM